MQFGVGARNGAEAIVHAISTMMDEHRDWIFFQTDFSNAYNSIYRSEALEAVREHFPQMLPWLRAIYTPRSSLWFDILDHREALTSEEGAQQGDPLGPFLFCAAMHAVVQGANDVLQAHGGGVALAYIDDIVGCGPEAAVRECFEAIERLAEQRGLRLQLHKCSAHRPDGAAITQLPAAVGIENEGLVVLGVPLGAAEFTQRVMLERVEELQGAEDAIAGLRNSQQAMVLLRMCYAQKLGYHLRTVDSNLLSRACIRFDESLERCFRRIVGIRERLSRQQWEQLTLDTKHGGFGLASCSGSRHIAYVASVVGCLANLRQIFTRFQLGVELADLETSQLGIAQRFRQHYQRVRRMLGGDGDGEQQEQQEQQEQRCPTIAEMVARPRGLQHRLSEQWSARRHLQLRAGLDRHGKLRLDSCSGEGGAWLSCVPKTPQQRLEPEDFRQRALARLGMDLPMLTQVPCVCRRASIDTKGFHLTAQCPVGNQRFRTHDAIAVTWLALFRQAGFLCRMEDPSCFREVQDTNKRADVVVENWQGRARAIFDVSVTHPWIQAMTRRAGGDPKPECAARRREQEKLRKYQALVPANSAFVPLVIESFGRWGPQAREVFDVCVEKVCASKGAPKAVVKAYWRQRFALVLQRYTAACVRERAQRAVVREPAVCGDESCRVDYRVLSYVR